MPSNKKNKYNIKQLAAAIIISLSAGFIGSVFTTPAIDGWYTTLDKPFFTPPNWLFGPVWTLLYVLIGVSLYLVWKEGKKASKWFWIQLALNTLWSIVFFGWQLLGSAFVVIAILWVAIYLTIRDFGNVKRLAGRLLYPYLAWVSFASLLNLAIWLAN